MHQINHSDKILDIIENELVRVNSILNLFFTSDKEIDGLIKEEYNYWKQQREQLVMLLMPKYFIPKGDA